jgi:hypothetical protein
MGGSAAESSSSISFNCSTSTRTTFNRWRRSRRRVKGNWESVPIGTFSDTSSSSRA